MATDQRSLRVVPAADPPVASARAAASSPTQPAVIEHDGSSHDAEHTCEACEQIRAAMATTESPVEVDTNAEDATDVGEPEVAEPEAAEPEAAATEVVEPEVAEPKLAATEVAEPEVVTTDAVEPEVAEPEVGEDWVLPADPIVAKAPKAPKAAKAPKTAKAPKVAAVPKPPKVAAAPKVPPVPKVPVAAATPAGPKRRRWLLLAVGALVVAIVAAVVVAIVLNKKDSTSSTKPAAGATSAAAPTAPSVAASTAASSTPQSPDVTAAIAWARQQLPLSSTLLADAQTAVALKAAGFTVFSAADLASAGASAPAFEYLVDTPALRQLAVTTPAASAALGAAVPVALFGPASNQVAIRQAVLDSATVVSARQAADEKFRSTAEAELLHNPAIHSSGSAAAALQSASLDLRAATVLAYVANSSTVQFANVTASAPETAAGLPIRSIDIKVTSQAVMQTIISGLPIAYQPSSVTTLSGGAVRMVWPITAEPLPSLS
jgi:hypothetical protein